MLPIVIVHGWSDSSRSFETLAHLLAGRGAPVAVIALAQYVSMNDNITFPDLVAAMDKAWDDFGLPRNHRSVDVIVHSTGALVVRDWLSRLEGDSVPIHHLVMLAPANFGSPLAHKGRSFIGRVAKGFTNEEGPLQTGSQILKGLELASPYTWDLAERDRFGPRALRYGVGGILTTVLIGNRGFDGIRAMANEDGGDGTVRVSTANLNCARLRADFSVNPHAPTFDIETSSGLTAFGVMNGHNHTTITLKNSSLQSQLDRALFGHITSALNVTDDNFDTWCATLTDLTASAMTAGKRRHATHGFQNTVTRVLDHESRPVTDYVIEFFDQEDAKEPQEDERDRFAKLFHTRILADVHAYEDDASFRSLYIDCTHLARSLPQLRQDLRMSLTAYPIVGIEDPPAATGEPVGFRLFRNKDVGSIAIPKNQVSEMFQQNRTLMVTIRIKRHRQDRVFRFIPAPK